MTKRDASAAAVEIPVALRRTARGRKRVARRKAEPPKPVELGNVPRIARLMALAIRFEGLVRDGVVRDYADLARLGGVSRARITQIMNLLLLAPEIQEEILFLPRAIRGKARITEKSLRTIVGEPSWEAQRNAWAKTAKSRR